MCTLALSLASLLLVASPTLPHHIELAALASGSRRRSRHGPGARRGLNGRARERTRAAVACVFRAIAITSFAMAIADFDIVIAPGAER